MQDKMKKLLDQIGMNSDYLENASINKIVVYDNNKLWNFVINTDRIKFDFTEPVKHDFRRTIFKIFGR